MTRKKQSQSLYVYMNGISVGKLVRESTGQLTFTYDQEWLIWQNTRPISLSMPLKEKIVITLGTVFNCAIGLPWLKDVNSKQP